MVGIAESAETGFLAYKRHTFTPFAWYADNVYLNLGQNAAAKTALKRAEAWHPQVLSNYGTALVVT